MVSTDAASRHAAPVNKRGLTRMRAVQAPPPVERDHAQVPAYLAYQAKAMKLRGRQECRTERFVTLYEGCGGPRRRLGVKKYILFDHDGVLVDTEFWYYKAAERALADVGLTLDKDQYLRDMNQGLGT